MNVQEAKARIGDIYRLGELRSWPLYGQSPELAWWRNNQRSGALSIFADGQLWKDHGNAAPVETWHSGGDMVDLLATAEGLTKGQACALIVKIAAGVAEAPSRTSFAPQATREQKRSQWPVLRSPVDRWDLSDEIGTVARRRRFPHFCGVRAACTRGLLVFLDWYETGESTPVPSWGVTDARRLAVHVRRMDGKPWRVREAESKSKSLPGSLGGWPIGIAEVGARTDVVLTEGEPDMLAAITLHCLLAGPNISEGRDPGTFGFCCMMGSGKSIAEEALPLFAGKTVRIVPHVDATGAGAAGVWGEQLTRVGAKVSLFSLEGLTNDAGGSAKDLNDVTTDRGFSAYRDELAQLFSP